MAKRGETREKILDAATKVFFEHGFEATSVKMILEEADVVTGSFYHFFPSKEILFEQVIERYLEDYSDRVGDILGNEELTLDQTMDTILDELITTLRAFYEVFDGNKLHWTVQCSLNAMTTNAIVGPLAQYIERLKSKDEIEVLLDVDEVTLAKIIIRGSEAIVHSTDEAKITKEELKAKLLDYIGKLVKF